MAAIGDNTMVTIQDIAKRKKRVQFVASDLVTDKRYDHVLQRSRFELDPDAFRISMKSDTSFDGEKDKGDEK